MIEFIGNRAAKLFQHAIEETEFSGTALFSYWDTYHGPITDYPKAQYAPCLEVMPRSITNIMDDKGRLGELMQGHSELLPVTYSAIEDIPQEKAGPNSLWFLKNRHGAGGKQVECVRLSDLSERTLSPNDILQEAITDLRLVEGRKYTIRAYALMWNRNLYLYDKWYRVVHGGIYSPDATDYGIQVSLRYSGGGTTFSTMSIHDSAEEFLELHEANSMLKEILKEIIHQSSRGTYSILGCDFVIQQSGQAQLIEINAYPNLVHIDANVANKVNYPMIRDTVGMLVTGNQPASWILLQNL